MVNYFSLTKLQELYIKEYIKETLHPWVGPRTQAEVLPQQEKSCCPTGTRKGKYRYIYIYNPNPK